MALSPDGHWLVVSNDGVAVQSVMLVDATTGQVRDTISYPTPESASHDSQTGAGTNRTGRC